MKNILKISFSIMFIIAAIIGAFLLGRLSMEPVKQKEQVEATESWDSLQQRRTAHDLLFLLSSLHISDDTQNVKKHIDLLIDIRIGEEFFGDKPEYSYGIKALALPESRHWLPLLTQIADFRDKYGWRPDESQYMREFLDAARQQYRKTSASAK